MEMDYSLVYYTLCKHTKKQWKATMLFMGKSTISTGPCSKAM